MNRYIIQYYSKTRAALADRDKQQTFPLSGWIFNYPNLPNYELTIALSDRIKRSDNVHLHTGLNIIADIKANSEDEAGETSKNHVETLLNLISFSTLTHCGSATLVSRISIDKEVHPFRYYVYPFMEQEVTDSLIRIDEPTFRTIFEAYNKSSYKPRTMRALTWLRKGIGEENVVDEFISYWMGLEVIRSILRRNLRYKTKNPGEWDGVKDIFTNKLSFQSFDAIKGTRRRLFHGGKEEDKLDNEFIREIESYVEPMRKALVFGVGNIWGLENNIILTIANKAPRRVEQPPWAVMEGNLKNLPRNFNELAKNYPTLDAEIIDKQFSVDQEGILSLNYKVSYQFRGPNAIKWEPGEIQLWGKKGAGIQTMHIKGVHVDRAKKSS